MKKLVLALAVASMLLSCKKETTESFKAEGFWRGNIYLLHLVVVNKENGKSRIYVGSSYGDTATASQKYDGVYEVKGSSFIATYYDGDSAVAALESDKTAPGKIWGRGYILQSGLQFELTKDQD
jgi:hypothetical protein